MLGLDVDHSPPPTTDVKNGKKVKFTLEQAMKAQRGSRSIALLVL
jgi:hypothetical protein